MSIDDISDLKFSSTVFPTAEDIALWESLSDDERLAIIERDEQAAVDGGIAEKTTLRQLLAEVRAEK